MSRADYFVAIGLREALAAKIVAGQADSRRVTADDADGDDTAGLYQLIAAALKQLGHSGQPVCLGLPSRMALSAQIDTRGIPRKGRKEAMVYRLEEQLPLDAEEMTADFLPLAAGRSLGLAVETARIAKMLDDLAQCGVEVASICPTALLAAWQACRLTQDSSRFMIVPAFDQLNVLAMEDGRSSAWYAVPADAAAEVVRHIQADLLARPRDGDATVTVVGSVPAELTDALGRDESLATTALEANPMELAARAASARLRGADAGWADLRTDALAMGNMWARTGKLLTTAVVLAIMLLASVTGLFLLRAAQHERLAESHRSQQRTQFNKLHPDRTAPLDVRLYLDSELSRLSGISGSGSNVPDRVSALNTLRDMTAAMPEAMRLCITEIRITPGGGFIQGRVRSFADAEAIAGELAGGGFQVDPPRSERRPAGGVRFFINLSLPQQPTTMAAATEGRP